MSRFSRRGLLGGLALAVGAGALASAAYAQDVVYIPTAPPTPRVETVPPPPPGRVETWQPGYWQWNGAGYVWVGGRYVETPRRGAVWIPGRWEHRPQGWIYVAGHWG
jgi:hypothetical protein